MTLLCAPAGWKQPFSISQLNRAIRYSPRVLEPARARRDSPPRKEAEQRENGARNRQRRKAAWAELRARKTAEDMMILASAMSHIVGRPAIRMEGGTINPMERLCPPPSASAFDSIVNTDNTAPPTGAKNVV